MGIPHVPDQYAVSSTQYAPLSTYVACTAYNPVWCLTETYYVIYIYVYIFQKGNRTYHVSRGTVMERMLMEHTPRVFRKAKVR